jgi:hypothetical protein
MPSPRVASFIDASVIEADIVPVGSERALPPASAGLTAPADVAERSDARRRRDRGAKVGRPLNAEAEEAVSTVFDAMKREMNIADTADKAGVGEKRVKSVMKAAKSKMQAAVEEYVDIHLVAAKVAALKGDARPAEWALENIAVEGERVVDPPQKNVPQAAPTFNIGFAIGGMPQRVALPAAKTDK